MMSGNYNQGRLYFRNTIGFLLLLLLIDSSVIVQGVAAQQPQRYTRSFGKGDAVRLTVWQPWSLADTKGGGIDFNGDYLIDSRGYVRFPVIGEVKVVTHTVETLAEELKSLLAAYMKEPVIVVEPLIRVTTLGALRRPGTYLIKPDASLWELVDLSGGPADDADLKRFWIERSGEKVKENLLSGFEKAYSLEELGVISGDQLFLPNKKRFEFRTALEILRFTLSVLNLYLLITRLND
jgi:protein involved in polysaccharide export with SLBB domain